MAKPKYRSKFEQKIANYLDKIGIRYQYEPFSVPYEQPVRRYRCAACGTKAIVKERTYVPDFVLPDETWIEAKGRLTGADRVKMVAVKEAYPDQKICFLFMQDNYTTKNKTLRYTEWALKNGFPCAVSATGKVPADWLYPEESDKHD